MSDEPRRVLVIGVDALVWPVLRTLADDGSLPAVSELLELGAMTPLVPAVPVWTPTNWASIATGAPAGAHGVVGWYGRRGGGEISSFDSRAVRCETVWQAASRNGRRSLVAHYPAAWPSHEPGVTVIDGFAQPGIGACPFEIAPPAVYVLDPDGPLPRQRRAGVPAPVEVRSSAGPAGSRIFMLPLASGLEQRLTAREDVSLFLWSGTGGRPDEETALGEWTAWRELHPGGRSSWTRFRTLRAPGTRELVVYRSQIVPAAGFGTPGACEEHHRRHGPFLEHASTIPYRTGLLDFETVLGDARYQADWLISAACDALERDEVELAMFHWHFLDHLNHDHLHRLDPACPGYEPERAEEWWDVFAQAYALVDRMVARALDCLDARTAVALVADHGCVSDRRAVNLRKRLVEEGFLVLRGAAPTLDRDEVDADSVDWERTTAYVPESPAFGIRVNVHGRRRREVVRSLLTSLRRWEDPETGESPVELALDREHAQLLGLYGPDVDDVTILWAGGYASGSIHRWERILGKGSIGRPAVFSSHHAGVSPLAETAVTSNLASFVLAGPGVRAGYVRDADTEGIPPITVVAPTLADVLGVDPPRHAQSGPLRGLFVDAAPFVETRPDAGDGDPTVPVVKQLERLGYL